MNRESADRHGKSRWANFVAFFTNREAKGSQVVRLKARETMRADAKRRAQPLHAAAASAAAAPAAAAACRRTRAARPIDLFREEMIKRDKRLLIKFNACSLEYWAKVREEFSCLDADTIGGLERRAANSSVEAARGRDEKRQRLGEVQGIAAAGMVADVGQVAFAQACRHCNVGPGLPCQRALALNSHCRSFDRGRDLLGVDKAVRGLGWEAYRSLKEPKGT